MSRTSVSPTLQLAHCKSECRTRILGYWIRQVSKDQEPVDLSDEKFIEVFNNSMGEWQGKMQSDKGGYAYGYIDLVGFEPHSYGVAY